MYMVSFAGLSSQSGDRSHASLGVAIPAETRVQYKMAICLESHLPGIAWYAVPATFTQALLRRKCTTDRDCIRNRGDLGWDNCWSWGPERDLNSESAALPIPSKTRHHGVGLASCHCEALISTLARAVSMGSPPSNTDDTPDILYTSYEGICIQRRPSSWAP